MRAYVNSGIAIARSVFTMALPRAGTTVSTALDRSKPAANSDPRVGMTACSESFFTLSTSEEPAIVDMLGLDMEIDNKRDILAVSINII